MKTMEKLYYIKGELGRESDAIEKLRSLGLNVSVIESHCYEYGRSLYDVLIAWNESAKYPCMIPFGLNDMIVKCGILVEY